MPDILEDLDNLVVAATTDRNHYYVAKVALLAGKEIKRLRRELENERWMLNPNGMMRSCSE